MTGSERLAELHELVTRLEAALAALEETEDSERAVETLGEMSDLAKEIQAEIDRARREEPDALG